MSVYNFNALPIDGKQDSFSAFKGKITLIVNIASKFGSSSKWFYTGSKSYYGASMNAYTGKRSGLFSNAGNKLYGKFEMQYDVIKNLKFINTLLIENITLSMVVQDRNYKEMDLFYNLMKKIHLLF